MKWFIIKISTALLVSILLCDTHIFIYYKFRETADIGCDLFLDPTYHYEQTILYYIHDLMLMFKDIVWAFCFAKVADLVSHKLYRVLIVMFSFHLTQFVFYVWNRNTTFISNIIVYIYIVVAIVCLFLPDKKGGKLINLEDH